MYTNKSAVYYDRIYASQGKDYQKEADYVVEVVRSNGVARKASLLDVACGTGNHLLHLKKHFAIEGVDVSLDFIRIARSKLPKTRLSVGDMRTFVTGREYDVVTCLFSSIGFMETPTKLQSAIRNMAKHLAAGGLLIVEPWFSPGHMMSGKVSMAVVDEGTLKLARISTTKVDGNVSSFDFHYVVGTGSGTEHFIEKHKLGLFTKEEMVGAFERCGLSVEYDPQGPTGRGLYIGKKK
jgi:ubiquinone/menaquinone biosynthesis C-methylase UbiE